eukprot:10889028-Alexandrium_andersonii.AAC.1
MESGGAHIRLFVFATDKGMRRAACVRAAGGGRLPCRPTDPIRAIRAGPPRSPQAAAGQSSLSDATA